MKASVHHIGYGQIEYNENFWTGKRELTIDGEKLPKKKKNVFTLNSEGEALDCHIKGSFLTGAALYVDQDVIQLTTSCKWYEILCSILIFVFVLIWGNSTVLCMFMPIVGGAVGGAISAFAAFANLFLMKQIKKVRYKLLAWLIMFIVTVRLCSLIAQFFLIFI